LEILNKQKKKKASIKKEIFLRATNPNGVEIIKRLLDKKEAEVKYIAAGKYSITIETQEIKEADKKIREILEEIERDAKREGIEFYIKEK